MAGIVMAVASVVGTAVSMMGSFSQASAYKQAASQQEQLAQQQLQMGQLQQTESMNAAANTRLQSQQDADAAIRQRRMVEGATNAEAGALGTSASSQDILSDIGNQGALQVQHILYAGETTAKSQELQGKFAKFSGQSGAISSYNQASNYRAQASQSTIGAFGTLIGGIGHTVSLFSQTQPTPFMRPAPVYQQNPLTSY